MATGRKRPLFNSPRGRRKMAHFSTRKEATLDIREIRVDQFGCWQDVILNSLPTGLCAIHLDDGGRPQEFSHFLFEVVYGFSDHKTAAGGAVLFDDGEETVWIDRQISSRGNASLRAKHNGELGDAALLLESATAGIDDMLASRFFLPAGEHDTAANWRWLGTQTELQTRLLHPKPVVQQTSRTVVPDAHRPSPAEQLQQHLQDLETQSRSLREQITARRGYLDRVAEHAESKPKPQLTAGEIDDELRMLQRQQFPLQQALDMAGRWKKWKTLSNQPKDPSDHLPELQEAFERYRACEAEKEPHLRVLRGAGQAKRPRSKHASARKALARLLEQASWVRDMTTSLPAADTPIWSDRDWDIRRTAEFVQLAEVNSQAAEQELRRFTESHDETWLHEEPLTVLRTEIAEDSPLADAPLNEQLDELKRRRIWIERDYECLLEDPSISAPVRMWISVLLVLSVFALFGTLLVVSPAAQLTLVALGLSGMVAAGAIRMSLDKRAAARLRRTVDRLSQLDREIADIAEELWDEEKTQRQRAERAGILQQKSQLQEAVVAANRRLDSAERAFREMLVARGRPSSLSPDQALNELQTRNRTPRFPQVPNSSPRWKRWIKSSQKILRHFGEPSHHEDPQQLLLQLEDLAARLRADRADGNADAFLDAPIADRRQVAKQELKKLDKRQQAILRRTKTHDVFELESAVEKAVRRAERRQEAEAIYQELSLALDTLEDGVEIRELLEMYAAPELEQKIAELETYQAELIELRQASEQQHDDQSAREISAAEAEVQQLSHQLERVTEEIQETKSDLAKAHDTPPETTSEVIEEVVTPPPPPQQHGYLAQLTGNRFDNLQLQVEEQQVALSHHATGEEHRFPFNSIEAELAWLSLRLQLTAMIRQARQVQTLPLLVWADRIFSTRHAARVFHVLQEANQTGMQIIFLSGEQTTVNQLVDGGASTVRIGLKETPISNVS